MRANKNNNNNRRVHRTGNTLRCLGTRPRDNCWHMPCSVAMASAVTFNYVLLAVAVDVLLSGTYTCLSRLVAVTFAVLLLRPHEHKTHKLIAINVLIKPALDKSALQ
ncbi:unnamed protein product [Polarella glacialis]|uniref:Uncharacterized protein n=1 Tax=Polarella glacialis TaxID=89957 RepID=A0A813LG82_POLGL|nr:unnamed protein product [Polarella glacialis]CAE8726683.1 unnamed protein product [Polarella glacialis]